MDAPEQSPFKRGSICRASQSARFLTVEVTVNSDDQDDASQCSCGFPALGNHRVGVTKQEARGRVPETDIDVALVGEVTASTCRRGSTRFGPNRGVRKEAIAATLALIAILLLAAAARSAPGSPTPADGPPMLSPRAGHQATLLATGQVLITGGCAAVGCAGIQKSAELLRPEGGRLSLSAAVAAMRDARVSHMAALLPDGRVLVAGGWTGATTTASAELFDPRTRAFTDAAPLSAPRMDGTSTLLPDGTVLLAGGALQTNRPSAAVDLFDPATHAMRTAGAMQTARAHHAAAPLPDGRVLVVGGLVGRGVATASAEIYDPRSGTFSPTGALRRPRCKHAALPLADGRVMVLAGSTDCDDRHRLASTELYDPARGSFEPGPTLHHPRYKVASAAAVLPGGVVVVAGDARDIEVWRPGTDRFVALPDRLPAGLAFGTATAVPGAGVLIAGGYDEALAPTARTWLLVDPLR